ncbi:hypothetical protein BRD03_10835 [Halobacteriales archaeon QS_9_68_17]|nr:MAG: hypothetical protein BRD03_10835 [Halobacteriales archaeon QS_9_68_17]
MNFSDDLQIDHRHRKDVFDYVEQHGEVEADVARRALGMDETEFGIYVSVLQRQDFLARENGTVRVAFDDSDEDLVEHWVELTESVFGFKPTTGPSGEAACTIGRANRRDLYTFLDRNDLLKDASDTATVPEAILRGGRTGVARFLRGLFEADGTVGERAIELYTHSEELAFQVQTLLLGLGIRVSVNEKRDGYRVSIRKNVCGKRFVERVGFISERKSESASRFEEVADNATSIKVPNQTEQLREWYQRSDLDHDAYCDLSQFLIDSTAEHHQEIGKGIFEQYAEQYPELWDSPVAEHVERDQFYEPISSVTEVGTMSVEDMQVPRRNKYVVEGFVSHNSPTLMNAGDELQQLSACFVDSPEDDIDDIHQTAKEAAQVFQSGGGMGYAFWKLRPYGDAVGSTGGIASGPITFMRTYDQMCFPPGTNVLTPDGQRAIENLGEGDLVIDENGDEQPIVETMERQVDEEVVEIVPERLNDPIRATGEHPFKVVREDGFEWVDARELTENDLLVLGHASDDNGLAKHETIDLASCASGPMVFTDGGATINREYYGADKGTQPYSIETKVPVADMGTIAGWYLAEGCVVYRRGIPNEVTFTLHADERDEADEIVAALDAFDVSSRIEVVEKRNTLHVHVENASFAQLIEGLFGTGSSEKRVPEFLWNAPVETQARVVEALFDGDGTTETRGNSQRVTLQLTCEEVIDWVFQVGLRCGVQFSRHSRTSDDRKPTHWVSASVSTALGTPLERLFNDVPDDFRAVDRTKQANGREVVAIDSIELVEYDGAVYNAEVADTHTYIAEDLVVHNCETIAQGGARRGAQMGVMRISHPDVIQFIHAKNKDVSLAHSLRLNDPDDYTHNSFKEALEEARELITDDGKVPKHLRNAAEGHLSNFNISVGVTDDFMDALENGEEFTFTNPRTGEPHVATEETKELYEMFDLGEYVEVGEELSMPAAVVWEDIVEGAHENGEPGVIYLERVNKEHSFDVEEQPEHRILATNPCVTGDTLISTENGLVTAEELYEQGAARDVVVDGRLSEDRVKEASSVYKTGEKDVYKLTTDEGYELRLTADHRVMTDDGWTEARNLEPGDAVHVQNRKGEFGQHGSAEEGRVLGWLVGDGHLKNDEERAVLNFYDEDTAVSEEFAADVNGVVRAPNGNANYEIGANEVARSDEYRGAKAVEQRIRSTRLYEYAEEAGLVDEKLQVPDAVKRGSEEMARGFLRALFSADGNVQGSSSNGRSIRLASSHLDLLKQTQRLLLNFGIASRIYENRRPAQMRELPDGNGGTKEHETKAQHELAITKDNQIRFAEGIGFLREDKTEKLEENLESYTYTPESESFTATVDSVTPDGHEAVYDLTEPETHSFVANGLVTHNCGEQPLEEYEACNLGHINLSTLADEDAPDWRVWYDDHADEYDSLEAAVDDFLDQALDVEELDRRIEKGTRFLENVVTMSDFPVDKIERKVREMRKIGLGVMGLAQLYIQLGIEYGSEEGNEVARQVMRHINHGSKRASHELAQERGSFDEWDKSKYANPTEYREWFEKQTGLDADDWADGFPIRNHNSTTIAPTGTTSMVGNTTGGCEPIYNVAYYKNVSDDVQGDEMLVEFDDYFLRVLEDNDLDVEAVKREAQEQMANNEFDGVEGVDTVPDPIGELFVVTGDLSGKDHAAVQTACQEGVDSAISKTCNFPNDATIEEMDEVYRYIYENGGKGVTVYRDGTRSKQVLTTRAKNAEFAEEGEAAEALVEQINDVFGGVEAFLENEDVRAALDEEVNEILSGADATGDAYAEERPRPDVLHGVTQRVDTGYGKLYVNINEDDDGEPFELFANIGNSGGFTASFTEALAKIISFALRSGVDPYEIADDLQGIRSPKVAWDKGEQIQSIPDAIGTALRRYLDGEIEKAYPQQKNLTEIEEGEGAAEPETDGGLESADSGAQQAPEKSADGTRGGSGPQADSTDQQDIIDAGESPECPDCGSMTLYYSEGCKTCESCGWSEC